MAFDHNHSKLNRVFSEFVSEKGGVRYKKLSQNRKELNDYTNSLARVKFNEVNSWTSEQQQAFWINAYNALTIQLILDNYPLKSIKKLWFPFKKKVIKIDGKNMSLDDIEHNTLRKNFAEPRHHAALVCASTSCPGLNNRAYTAENLNEELDRMFKRFINNSSKNKIEKGATTVHLSKIFTWYGGDFKKAGGVKKVIANYLDPDKAAALMKAKVEYLEYDWGLNEL